MIKVIAQHQPASILECGVGTGLTLHGFPEAAKVVGIDVSEAMLAIARLRASLWPKRDITLECLDAENMHFANASFDCVVLPYILSVTPDPVALVAEVRRVCKPGGLIIVVNHFSGSRFWWLLEACVRPLAAKIGFHSDFEFKDHIERHDWIIESIQSVNLLGLSKLVVIRNV